MGCHYTEIAGCNFSDFGQMAVSIGDTSLADAENLGGNGGSNNIVRSCNITRTGQGGIFLGGGNRYKLEAGNNTVENCDISNFATIVKTYCPAVDVKGCGNSVIRNRMYNAPHAAIIFYGNDHLIEGNEIFNVLTETTDAGAIYTGRRWSARGNKILNNILKVLGL